MATGTITNHLSAPDGTPLEGVVIQANLLPSRGFLVSNPGVEITSFATTTTDAAGDWSLVLTQNSDIEPENTAWVITELIPPSQGVAKTWTVRVAAGTNSLFSSLVEQPPATNAPDYLTQEVADARYMPFGALTLGSIQGVGTATQTGTATTAAASNHIHPLRPEVAGSGLALTLGTLAVTDLTNANMRSGNLLTVTSTNTSTATVSPGQVRYNSNSTTLNLYSGGVGGIWIDVQRVPHTDWSGILTVTGSRTKTAASWTDFPTTDLLRVQNFVKVRSDTKLIVRWWANIFDQATGGFVDLGAYISGVIADTQLGRFAANAASDFRTAYCEGSLGTCAAGTYTIQARWMGDGTNTFEVNATSRAGMTVTETL